MSYRFFTQSTPNHGKMVLEGEQARHAIQVMRFNVGDQIVLFDGTGTEYEAANRPGGEKTIMAQY